MSIEIGNESGMVVDESALQRVAAFALDQMKVSALAELGVTLVDEAAMEQLHVQWMDEPGPTDVLSFPMDELRPGTNDDDLPDQAQLGDVVLCPQVAAEQAIGAKHSTQAELEMLTVHGILHLLGFDHADPDEEREMFGLQREILTGFAGAERQR